VSTAPPGEHRVVLSLVALLTLATIACDGPAPREDSGRVISVGPVRADRQTGQVRVDYSVFDPEGGLVQIEASLCVTGESCAGGTCQSLRTLSQTQNPFSVHGDPDPLDLRVRTMRWPAACDATAPEPATPLRLCLAVVPPDRDETGEPSRRRPLETAEFTLEALGLQAEPPPGAAPCP